MPATPKAPVNPLVLSWARDAAGYTVEDVARRLRVKEARLQAWEAGDRPPTLGQVRRLASLYRRPVAFFFREHAPADDTPHPPDFRGRGFTEPSPTIKRELRRAADRRRAFLDLGSAPANRLQDITPFPDDVPQTADAVRRTLGVELEDQLRTADGNAALRLWIQAAEQAGTLVFHMSRVDPQECRGIALYADALPVVMLNGADPPVARQFTLLHELGHLVERSGSLCLLWGDRGAEQRANRLAAEILMPGAAFRDEVGGEPPIEAIPRLARTFRVSEEAAAVRLRDLELISAAQLRVVRQRTAERVRERRETDREREGGPPHHRTHLRNLGTQYVSAVLDAYHEDRISVVDAAHFLEAKVATIDRMEEELVRGSRR
jgi:Zn-dependent peptidase ImmA (M78 family)/transcriptional regulator with XRE-family HTH domain